jgi:hypothetical protein
MTTPAKNRTAWRPTFGISFWIVAPLALLLLVIGTATSGFSGFLIMAGLIALLTAIYSAVTGRGSWISLPNRKIAAGLLAAAIVVVGAGGAVAGPSETPVAASADLVRVPSKSATPSPTPTPEISYGNEEVLTELPFAAVTIDDPNALVGTSSASVAGAPGVKTTTYRVTYVDGVATTRELVGEVTTTAPIDAVTAVGSKPIPAPAPAPAPVAAPSGCDPNYSGQCVPIASDVDCAGGSGDGPGYTAGPVRVIGSDIYDLDRDGDGIACDK